MSHPVGSCVKAEEIGALKSKVDAHDEWNKRQNGSLQRIEGKVDKLSWLLIAALLAIVGDIALRAIL